MDKKELTEIKNDIMELVKNKFNEVPEYSKIGILDLGNDIEKYFMQKIEK